MPDERIIARTEHNRLAVLGNIIKVAFIATISIIIVSIIFRLLISPFENAISDCKKQLNDIDNSEISDLEYKEFHYNSLLDIINQQQKFINQIKIFRAILIIIIVFTSAIYGIITAIKLKCQYLILTNKKLYGKKEIITKNILEIPIEKIDTVRVKTPLMGRIFQYSTLEIVSPASAKIFKGTTVNEKFPFIKNVNEFRKAVIEAIEAVKSK